MDRLLRRPGEDAQRWFPAISPDFYSREEDVSLLSPDQRAARRLLALSTRRFGPVQRCWGWGLGAADRLARLLWFHRHGLEAEMANRWTRADFFWRECVRQVRNLCRSDAVWNKMPALIADGGEVEGLKDAVAVRHHFVGEVLVDTHCACYNGRIVHGGTLRPDDRAFVHIGYLDQLVSLLNLAPQDARSLRVRGRETQIDAAREAKAWDVAIRTAGNLLEEFPDDPHCQSRLSQLHIESTLSQLGESSKDVRSLAADAKSLARCIDEVGQLSRRYRWNTRLYTAIAELHHIRAVKLANGGRLSAALVEIEKARTYDPSSSEIVEAANKLQDLMKTAQIHARALRSRLRTTPDVSLNAAGRALLREADRGYKPRDKYRQSDEARALRDMLPRARARTLWQHIGLAEPADEWDRRAAALERAVGEFCQSWPHDPDPIPEAWRATASDDPDLQSLDASCICAYLQKLLFDHSAPAQSGRPEEPPPAPLLPTGDGQRRFSIEPILPWTFSLRNLGTKLAAAAAVAAALGAVVLTVMDSQARRTRESAFELVLQAAKDGDEDAVSQHAAAFLTARPVARKDLREQAVLTLQSHAQELPPLRRRDAAYQELLRAMERRDAVAAVKAADEFLAAPPIAVSDGRENHVRALREAAQELPALRQRDAAYQELLRAIDQCDVPAGIGAADRFLAARSIGASDGRRKHVLSLRASAQELPPLWQRDAAYEELLKATESKDVAAAIQAAERFLAARPIAAHDGRQEQVLRLYQQAFVSWFAGREGELDAATLAQVDRFRKLAGVASSSGAQK